jgi:hypothetical protein
MENASPALTVRFILPKESAAKTGNSTAKKETYVLIDLSKKTSKILA